MGDFNVRLARDRADVNTFTKHLLTDIQALEKMLADGLFETDIIRIGAEQEMCLVDTHAKPAPLNIEVLEKLNNPSFTTELAKFNLEANLDPLTFSGNCISACENDILRLINELRDCCMQFEIAPVLTGILPTIRKSDINLDKVTPNERYYALIRAINQLRGENYELRLEGLDELNVMMDSPLIEACNTSFQVHLQIKPEEFVTKYNIAQAVAAPVLALATNSPMLFGKRLWSETRIGLFRQSIDTRFASHHLRERSPRVTFGTRWLKGSIADLYKEDIMRFSVMFMSDIDEDVFSKLEEGITPKLRALNIHNSTVYRWNRPCYGISPNGKPHLRIENRVLPAGPTVADETANMALWLGLMNGLEDVYPNLTERMEFDDAKTNFLIAARHGLGAKYTWTDGKKIHDTELIKKELLPIARQGLEKANIDKTDIDRYLGIIEERNESGLTGSRWMSHSYAKLLKHTGKEEAQVALTAATIKNQRKNIPVHLWPDAGVDDIAVYEPTEMLVEEFMTTDIFTVNATDIPELSADIMDWQRIRYIPVENEKSEIVGLVTSRILLRYFLKKYRNRLADELTIGDLMITEPMIISPQTTLSEAMKLMRDKDVGCLPVVNNTHLVGLVTEANFLSISRALLQHLRRKGERKE